MLEPGLEMGAATAVCVPAFGNRLHQDMRIGWSISGQHFLVALHALLQHVLKLGDGIEREVGNWQGVTADREHGRFSTYL